MAPGRLAVDHAPRARRRLSSPPVVFRAATAEELAAKIREYEVAPS